MLLATALAAPPACARPRLEATVSPDLRTIAGELSCDGPLGPALATYPRLLRAPVGVDDVTRPWLYPRGFSRADLTLASEGTPLDAPGAWQPASPDLTRVRFTTVIPERTGPFGRLDGTAYLLAGWHPMPGRPGEPLPDAALDFAVRVPPGTAGFVGTVPFGVTSPRVVRGQFVGRFLPMVVSPALEVTVGPDAVFVRSGPADGRPDVTACRDETALTELAATLALGSAFARRGGLAPRRLIVVVAPARQRLVEPFDGGLLVSDRAFHVPDLELFRRFHRLALWRGQLAALALPHARLVERSLAPRLAADAAGAALRDTLARERYGHASSAPELLEPFAVIPEIESLIYAPQIPLVDAYFDVIDERGGGAPTAADFESPLPRGKLLYEKLADWVGREPARELLHDWVTADRPLLELVRERAGSPVEQALAAWLGPPPSLGYSLGPVASGPGHVTVEVRATGADMGRVREPVTVAVEDARGVTHRATRVGPGEVTVEGDGPPEVVELDPDRRLADRLHPPGFDPRFDDRDPARWRFLLNNITGLLAVTNQQLTASADFSLRRIGDLRHRLDFVGQYAPDSYELGTVWSYGWGEEITPLRLANRTGLGLTGDVLRVSKGIGKPGYELSATAFHVHDTRPSLITAYEGQGLSMRVTVAGGLDRDGGSYGYARASASALRIVPLSGYHALVGRLRADVLVGDPPPQQNLRQGGRYTAGRGYEVDEGFGRRRVVASIEDRHAWSVGTRSDLFGLLTLTGVEGALFADAVYLPLRAPSCGTDVFFDAGYGLRFLVDVLSVSPSSIALDVGVPLNRCAAAGDRAPVTVYLAFVQSFLVF